LLQGIYQRTIDDNDYIEEQNESSIDSSSDTSSVSESKEVPISNKKAYAKID